MRYQFYPIKFYPIKSDPYAKVDIELTPYRVIQDQQVWEYSFSVNDVVIFEDVDLLTPLNKEGAEIVDTLLSSLCLSYADLEAERYDYFTADQKDWCKSYVCEAMWEYVDNLYAIREGLMYQCMQCGEYFLPATYGGIDTDFCDYFCETIYFDHENESVGDQA